MEEKYRNITTEELLQDQKFIDWFIKGMHKEFFEELIQSNKQFLDKVNKAKEIISLVEETSDRISEEDILKIWRNIERYAEYEKSRRSRNRVLLFTKWAAVVVITISITFFAQYIVRNYSQSFEFSDAVITQSDESVLILPDGQLVNIHGKNNSLNLNRDSIIHLNNVEIVDLKSKIKKENVRNENNEIIVPNGKKVDLLLPDGTKVSLNSGSRMAFPISFSENSREVFLEGEGSFNVEKDANRPFYVNTGRMRIKVLGTYFNVSAYESSKTIETVLLEGIVEVASRNILGIYEVNKEVLKPYQKAIFDKKSNKIQITEEPFADIFFAWRDGWLQFNNEPVENVFAKIERYYDVKIKLPETFSAKDKITGKLDLKDSLSSVLYNLSYLNQIDYEIIDDIVYIRKKLK
jgi:ferric-dicitrate binding protein FerR (iron transport regulator)